MKSQTVTLPWPPKALSPNARVHWSVKAKAAKAYRHACFVLAKEAKLKASPGRVSLSLKFYPPDRRARDDDNIIAAFKSGRDGLADALGINDKDFLTAYSVAPYIGGMVVAEIY